METGKCVFFPGVLSLIQAYLGDLNTVAYQLFFLLLCFTSGLCCLHFLSDKFICVAEVMAHDFVFAHTHICLQGVGFVYLSSDIAMFTFYA